MKNPPPISKRRVGDEVSDEGREPSCAAVGLSRKLRGWRGSNPLDQQRGHYECDRKSLDEKKGIAHSSPPQ